MDLVKRKIKSESDGETIKRKSESKFLSEPKVSKVKSENNLIDKCPATKVTNQRSNVFNLFAPSFLEGGLPTMVPIPTNVPMYPSYQALSWMQKKLPENRQVDYYDQLLGIIEEIGKDLRPILTGNRFAVERIKRCIIQGRLLISQIICDMIEKSRKEEYDEIHEKMVNDRSGIETGPKNQSKLTSSTCTQSCCQNVQNQNQKPLNKLSNQMITVNPENSAFSPLTIKCPDYPEIRLNKLTGKPTIVKPGQFNQPNLVPMWNQHERLLIKAPKYHQQIGNAGHRNGQSFQVKLTYER